MGELLHFPKRRRRRPRNPATSVCGRLKVFPPAGHIGIISTIVDEMRRSATEDGAEGVLISHLVSECFKFDALGFGDDEIAAACEAFAAAAWKRFYSDQVAEGVA